MGLLGDLVCGGRGALNLSGCPAQRANVIGPGIIILLVSTGAAKAGHGLAEGGGGHEGDEEEDRGAAVGHQLDQPDAPGAQAGGGAQSEEEDHGSGGPQDQLDPVALKPLQCGAVGGG